MVARPSAAADVVGQQTVVSVGEALFGEQKRLPAAIASGCGRVVQAVTSAVAPPRSPTPTTADCLADELGKPKEEVKSWTPYPGGAPANVATGLARLGVHSLFLGALGRDELGDRFMALLAGAVDRLNEHAG